MIALLVKKLDQLALAYHFADSTFDDDVHPDPPEYKYDQMRSIVTARFPSLGFYNVPHEISTKICQTSMSTGDATDDLTDITLELKAILWRWQNTSIEDALWHYRFTFGSHWGQHLRDLQRYIHDLMSENGYLLLDQTRA